MFAKIPWYSIGRFTLIVSCLILVLALVVTVLPIYLDITAFKEPIEELLSDLAEAPVTVEEVRLHPSPWPTLRVAGVEVASAREDSSVPFARIGRAEIRVSLLPLLRKQLRLQRFIVSDATIHAHRPEGSSGNWPVRSESSIQIKELAGIEFENVTLNLEDHDTVRATMVIDHLTCDIADDRALDLGLRGSLQGLPLSIEAAGPTLAAPLSQASDFPLSLGLQLADLRVNLEGSASREPGGTRFQFAFDIGSEGLAWVRELGGPEVPRVGGIELSGQLSNREASLEISELRGSVGSTTVHGRLTWDLPDGTPKISGRLALGKLDLEPWLSSASGGADPDTSAPLPFSLLSSTNAALQLTLQELLGLAVAVEDIDLDVELTDGSLSVPANLRAAGIPLSAQLDLQVDTEVPLISSRVSTRDLSLTQLDDILEIPDDLEGEIGALELAIISSGSSVDEILANLVLQADADESTVRILDDTGEQPVEILVDHASATHRPESPLTSTARGSIFDESFTIDLQTSPLADLIRENEWPVTLGLRGAGATLELTGTLAQATTGVDFDFDFDLSGDRAGALENWLGFPSQADHPYDLTGQLTSATDTRLLRLDESFIGRTHFTGEFAWSDEDEPFMVTLHATALDLRQLQDLSNSVTDLDTEQDVIGIDMPILPSKKSLHDAEIELTVDRLLRDPVDLTNANASLHIGQGHLERSPFSFAYDTQQFTGEISLDLRQEIPRLALEFHGHGERLGEILEKEGIVEGSLIVAQQVDLRIDASGASVREIIQSADLTGQLLDVRWQIQPAVFDEPVNIQLDRVDLSGPRGEPIVLSAKGLLNQEPLDLRLTLRIPADPQELQTRSIPFDFALGLAGTKIDLDGEVELPITKAEFDMQMVVEGETLATLSALTDTDLPDLGPYRLESSLAVEESGFSVKDLALVIGQSDMKGEISYLRIEDRPTFKADLTSQLLRTEDLLKIDQAADGEGQDAETSSDEPRLTLDHFNGFDAALRLAVREILTSDGSTEDTVLNLDLERGNFDLVIEQTQSSGELAELRARIRPWEEGLETEVRAVWDRLPYGWLTEVLRPGLKKGSWSIDLDLKSRGSSLRELAANLSGHLDLADYPADINATMFDLWGGGLLTSLLPVFQLGTESQINCAVAKFQVEKGVLTPELLIIDSTRSRIRGKGTIDLPGDEIRLRLKPRPKQRSLINLATPVFIRGSLSDPDVDISKGGLAVTFFRLSLWVYTVWRDLARTPLPANGDDVCLEPFAPKDKQ